MNCEMKTSLQLLCLLVLVLTFNPSVDSKDFCSAFSDNGNRISYTIQSRGDPVRYEMVINGLYWTLNFKDAVLSIDNEKEGKVANDFSNDYSMAASLRTLNTDWKDSYPFLFKRSDPTKVKKYVPKDTDKWREIKDYIFNKNLTLTGDRLPDNPILAFSEDIEKGKSILVVFNQKGSGYEVTGYDINEEGGNLKLTKKTLKEENYRAISQLKQKSLFGVLPKWNNKAKNYGLVLLFGDKQDLKWCYTLGPKLENCDPLKTLRSCPAVAAVTGPQPEEPTEESDSGLIVIVIIVLVIVVIILVIGAVVYYFMSGSGEGDEATSQMSTAPGDVVLSKRSADVQEKSPSKASASKVPSATAQPSVGTSGAPKTTSGVKSPKK